MHVYRLCSITGRIFGDFFHEIMGGDVIVCSVSDLHKFSCGSGSRIPIMSRAVDPHSFYADPDPAVFLNADPEPGPV